MKEVIFTVMENKKLSSDVFLLSLKGYTTEIKNSGEFVELALNGFYLRRPISVHSFSKDSLVLLYKVLGFGTKAMSLYEPDTKINVLVGLGNGFRDLDYEKPLLIGGGIGIAPLLNLALDFNKKNIKPLIILGFKTKDEVILEKEFNKLGNVIITTDDGTYGYKGNAVSYLKEFNPSFDKYYACGPLVMLKYLSIYNSNGYLSLEARMGCGFGACMGCSIKTTNGFKRVCKEGPVFKAEEVIFE